MLTLSPPSVKGESREYETKLVLPSVTVFVVAGMVSHIFVAVFVDVVGHVIVMAPSTLAKFCSMPLAAEIARFVE